ncbi:phosphonate ABC transporter, permease protein PhnE [Halegenticoccus tardaugens]|uniref:phosphonate ABC transporter, permease protein PhnE n=1 Tax=Halegenticoccus tardaugens TaxID=2071624 RepID=UPI00100BDEDD|nr:phosphonate ABC transporter, permease protein PhnE [Halegenticoccus tardaugens]
MSPDGVADERSESSARRKAERTDGGSTGVGAPIERKRADLRRRRRKRRIRGGVVALVLLALFSISYVAVGFSVVELVLSWPEFREALREYFPPGTLFGVVPFVDLGRYWEFIVEEELLRLSIVTVSMGLLGTMLGAPGALLLGVLGSERVTPFPFNFVFRSVMSVIRAIPALVWALIFIPLGGVTPFTGTLAIAVDTMGYLGRLFTDELEEIETGPIEGIQSTGASGEQTVVFGMLSQVVRQYIAWTMYVFEINVRIAISLGIIGAGGLGLVLDIQRRTFQYTNMMAAILVSVVLILLIEFVSQRIRASLRGEESQGFVDHLRGFPDRMTEAMGR